MLQVDILKSGRVRSEPLVDYRHSQILKSTIHMDKPKEIFDKKERVKQERVQKTKAKGDHQEKYKPGVVACTRCKKNESC